MLYAFTMDIAGAEEFYRRCQQYEAITEDDRNAILAQMAHEGLIKGVTVTKRSREEYIHDLERHFKTLDATEGFGDGQ